MYVLSNKIPIQLVIFKDPKVKKLSYVLFSKEKGVEKDADTLNRNCGTTRCLKITEKVLFNIASEASYVYIFT